jgi:hypothetical protein
MGRHATGGRTKDRIQESIAHWSRDVTLSDAQYRPKRTEKLCVDRNRARTLRLWAIPSCLAVALVTAAVQAPAVAAKSPAAANRLAPADATLARVAGGTVRPVVLVIGDSLVEQAADQLRADSNSGVEVRVTDRLGTAPCDWTGGDFDAALAAAHPTVVVLAFSGNAGAAAGCVNSHTAYPLADLLSNYREHLTDLANRATAAGATVVISTPPARNPMVAAPSAVPTAAERAKPIPFYGFQGVPAIRDLYVDMVNASGGRWHFSDMAALAVSPDFVFHQTLACEKDDGPCPSGFVSVRKGGTDAIHLDRDGHGATRFAHGLVSAALTAINAPAGV